jgi:O-antigen/teichoic acid export membrane protein
MILTPILNAVVIPLLSRARAASEAEMMMILRRVMEALIVMIAPITVMISAGADLLIKLAFGDRYAPAATGLSILTLVFVLTYLNMILSSALIVLGRSWSVTLTNLTGVASMTLFMMVFVPLGRATFHTGGECAGAAMAFIANETCVNLALLPRFRSTPLDGRNLVVLGKTLIVSAIVLVLNHVTHSLGFVRLVLDGLVYVTLALALGLVRPSGIRKVLAIIRARNSPTSA